MQFSKLDDLRALCRDLPEGDLRASEAAARRQQMLTKPPGSLGRLEELAIWLAHWQGRAQPRLDRITIAVFAGNHGVAARGVSAYPAGSDGPDGGEFCRRWCGHQPDRRAAGATLKVGPIALERPTCDFTTATAMDEGEFLQALALGYRAVPEVCDLLAVGEMGIANTTAAATLCAALLGGGARWAGRGTGVDDQGLARKREAIEAALQFHRRRARRSRCGGGAPGRARAGGDRGARGAAAADPCIARRVRGGRCRAAAVAGRRQFLDHCRAGHVSAEAGERLLRR